MLPELSSLSHKALLNAFNFLLINISFQGLSLFMPTVVATREYTHSSSHDQENSDSRYSRSF